MTGHSLFHTRNQKIIVMTVLFLQFCLAAWSSWLKSPTYDEPNHLRYGRQIVEKLDYFRFDNSKMPISALNAMAEKAGGVLFSRDSHRARRLFSRLPTLFMAVGITLIVWIWVRRMWGDRAGLAALVMAACDPNILGHGRWVTTDVPLTFFVVLTLWQCHEWCRNPRIGRGVIVGACTGGMLLTKFSALVFLPIICLVGLSVIAVSVVNAGGKWWPTLMRGLVTVAGAGAVAWVVLWAGYGFQGLDTRAGEPLWKSPGVIQWTEAHPDAILPLPAPYLQGIDWCSHDDDLPVEVYFLGKTYTDPVGNYFPLLLLLKTPLGILLIWFLALVTLRFRDMKRAGIWITLGPALFYILSAVFLLRTQLGIRFMLPVYPLFHVFASRIFKGGTRFRTLSIPASVVLLWAVGSTFSFFPHFLPYCNELAGGRLGFYRYFADSNSDWGQDRELVRTMDLSGFESPVSINPETPVWGTIVVSVNNLVGILGEKQTYRWLRNGYDPSGHVGYSHLIYRVPFRDLGDHLTVQKIAPVRTGPPPGESGFREVLVTDGGDKPVIRTRNVEFPGTVPDDPYYSQFKSPLNIEWSGFLYPEEPIQLLLSTVSDDGSQVLLNKERVVDNRGAHGARPGASLVALDPGIYHLIVYYEDRGGDRVFQFQMMESGAPATAPPVPVYLPLHGY